MKKINRYLDYLHKNYSKYCLEHIHHLQIVPAPKIDRKNILSIFGAGIKTGFSDGTLYGLGVFFTKIAPRQSVSFWTEIGNRL